MLTDEQKTKLREIITDFVQNFESEKQKLLRIIKMMVSTWSKEPSKRYIDLSTPILKTFVEKNSDAFRTFAKSIGFAPTS